MILKLSMLVNLLCSLFWIFQSAKGQFYQTDEQSLKRVIDADESFSNINTETLDVQKLNRLISLIDKTWILPRPGTHQPVGSNFKYKKTCANIYQTQKDVCQQVGFGTMCFNYCFEQGQPLKFQCKDVADPTYCKNNSAFDSFLTQYQKDSRKAKSYIRQMISRCYATAICDTQSGILNTTIIDENNGNSNEVSNLNPTIDNSVQINVRISPQNIKQQETEQAARRLSEIQPIRPIPIWQLLLLRHRMIAAAKSFPNVKATEDNGPAEILSAENLKKFGSREITEEDNSKNINNAEYTPEILIEETTKSTKQTASKKGQNEEQAMERLRWLCKMLQQTDKKRIA
uniref:Uncharacterized protein n=1 Tax=Elaeophora elaphi TaxID=1147741 RepID=A0A0R3RRH6_9BILA